MNGHFSKTTSSRREIIKSANTRSPVFSDVHITYGKGSLVRTIGMDPVLDKVVAGNDLVPHKRTVLLVCFVSHNNTNCSTSAEQRCTTRYIWVTKNKVHRSLKNRKKTPIGRKEDCFFSLDCTSIKGDCVIWVIVIPNNFVCHIQFQYIMK